MSHNFNFVQLLCIWAIPVLFAITLHEVAHGWVARWRGDSTAYLLGRLSLNPIRHIDLVGTVIVPLLLLTLGGFLFGWAKPVPVNYRHLRNLRWDIALVAIAGPLANFAMMFIWAVIAIFAAPLMATNPDMGLPLRLMASAGIQINLVLALLNLLPIPPLDGSRVLSSFLSPRLSLLFNRLEPYGFLILVFLIVTGVLSRLLSPPFLGIYLWLHKSLHLAPIFL